MNPVADRNWTALVHNIVKMGAGKVRNAVDADTGWQFYKEMGDNGKCQWHSEGGLGGCWSIEAVQLDLTVASGGGCDKKRLWVDD